MKKIIILTITIAILAILLLTPCIAYAHDPFETHAIDLAPLGLDSVQANRWVSTNPLARPYLARLYDIPRAEAIAYGALYEPRSYDDSPNSVWPDYVGNVYVEPIAPFSLEHADFSDYTPIVVKYDAPPELDLVQQTAWGQAKPWARPRLAQLYGVSKEVAIQYGAEY